MLARELDQPLLAPPALGADLGEAGGDDAERADAGLERFLRCAEHVLAGQADHGEIDLLRDVGDARVAADAGHRLAAAVDGIGRAGEVSGEDVAEELAADRAAPRGRADHGHARRREESLQRRGDRDVVPLRDAIAVELCRCDREANLDRAAVELAHDVEAGVTEDEQHRTVLREHLGDELLDPGIRRQRDEALEQAGADAAALVLVVDGERDLGGAAVAQPRVVGESDDASVETPDQRAALVPVRLDERLDELRREMREAVEAQVTAPVGEAAEEVEDGLGVGGERRPQSQRRAVAEDHVFGIVSQCAHVAPPMLVVGPLTCIVAPADAFRGFSALRSCYGRARPRPGPAAAARGAGSRRRAPSSARRRRWHSRPRTRAARRRCGWCC